MELPELSHDNPAGSPNTGGDGSGFHPAMVRDVRPRLRVVGDPRKSPAQLGSSQQLTHWLKMARIASASASVIRNIRKLRAVLFRKDEFR